MQITNCCGAEFTFPGWPDSDVCSKCKEHAAPEDRENNPTMEDIGEIN